MEVKQALGLMVLWAVSAAGCSLLPPGAAANAESGTVNYSFYSADNYKTVFARVLLRATECVPSIGLSRTKVTGELFENTQSARIAVAQQGISGNITHMPIEITTENGKTRVTVQNSLKRWNSHARAVQAWALDETKGCEPAT